MSSTKKHKRYFALRVELSSFPLGLINHVFWYQNLAAERDSTWLALYFDERLSVMKYPAFISNTSCISRAQTSLALTEKEILHT